MNILHINTVAQAGGAARAMYRLCQGLERQGQNPSILSRFRAVVEPDVYTIAEITGERRRSLGRYINAASSYADRWGGLPYFYRSTKRILETKLFQQAQVIHFHNLHGWYFNYHLLPAFTERKPVVWTLHDMWAFTGHCAYAYDCTRWKTGCFDCPLLKEPGRQTVEPKPTLIDRSRQIWRAKQQLYQKSNLHIVTPSHWLCELVQESMLSQALSVQCIPHGIDLDIYRPRDRNMARQALDIPLDARVILFVAANISQERKGFAYLLQALDAIQDAEQIVLLTIGTETTAGERLARFRRRSLGRLSDDRLLALTYSAADLFILPTQADNQPLTLIEALACGTPIVSFDVGGVPDMVRHLETGYLARYQDASDMTRGILTLLEDDDLRARMRQRCREIAQAEYGLDLQARRHIELYQRAIEEHKNVNTA